MLAPHLVYPTRTGANILIDRRWCAFSSFVSHVDIVAAHEAMRFVDGELVARTPFNNKHRSKGAASARTLLRNSHYLREKFVTKRFIAEARHRMDDRSYSLVVGSFLYTLPLLGTDPHADSRHHIIETHNDEFLWYRHLCEATSNPLVKAVASLSEKWSARQLQRSTSAHPLFLHLTQSDVDGFRKIVPDHQYLVAPIGVSIPETLPESKRSGDDIHLLFVGSLDVKMNVDALSHFANTFFPHLKVRLGEKLFVDIVGRSPGDAVQRLAEKHAWRLHADVSENQLASLLRKASFTFLPFPYGTGAKLKLLESLAHGVPFLATTHVRAQLDSIPPLCLFDNAPSAWLSHIQSTNANGQSLEDRMALVDVAKGHSWEASAKRVYDYLANNQAVAM